MYSLFFVFFFFVSVSAFFRVFLNKNTKKLKILVWLLGEQKRGFAPHLNYWGGARARAAPQSLRLCLEENARSLAETKNGALTHIKLLDGD